MVKVAASILAANQERLKEEVIEVTYGYADMIHIDVMDGKFVDNETNGEYMYKTALDSTFLPLDVHLMVENPLKLIDTYKQAFRITFHIEAVNDEEAKRILKILDYYKIKSGISIKPNTPVSEIEKYIDKIDSVLVMTVEPGYGGQELIYSTLEKVKYLREKYPNLNIEVDGGINQETSKDAINAGANILVAGTAIFKYDDREKAIKNLIVPKMEV